MNDIFLIMSGANGSISTRRRALISTPDHCFMVERYPKNELAIWIEGFSADDGKQLVDAYKRGASTYYGRLLHHLMGENQNEGSSERGTYTREEFSKLISDLGYGIDKYADDIYDAMWEMDYGMRVLNREE